MSLIVLHPRLYSNLLETSARPHTSLKVRREIEKLRAKKREGNRIQINLEQEDAQAIAGIIYEHDLIRFENAEEMHSYMEQIAVASANVENMDSTAYVGFSSSEWKAITELASGAESSMNLKELPAVVFYNMAPIYDAFVAYFEYMVGRAYGYRSPTEVEDERKQIEEMNALSAARIEQIERQNNATEQFATAFGAQEVVSEPAEDVK